MVNHVRLQDNATFFLTFLFLMFTEECPRNRELGELLGQVVGLIPPLFYCFEDMSMVLLLHDFLLSESAWLCS